ncbi:MAG: hypothetical protein C5S38_01745 [Candidatus Methanophagaceae archaeon]|nr:MAG: hypothetical protein C5S38_01745 [Methanophagales archaeon]KAF5435445.1 hypothetical protein C5S36_03150 [Methanophagales archaeon]
MQPQSLSYKDLRTNFKKGLRNGNWRRQRFLDEALFRAAMWYAKNGGSIVNGLLMAKILALVGWLKETRGTRIFKRGFVKASEMLNRSEEDGVFVWAPRLKDWLKDPDYVFWRGMGR